MQTPGRAWKRPRNLGDYDVAYKEIYISRLLLWLHRGFIELSRVICMLQTFRPWSYSDRQESGTWTSCFRSGTSVENFKDRQRDQAPACISTTPHTSPFLHTSRPHAWPLVLYSQQSGQRSEGIMGIRRRVVYLRECLVLTSWAIPKKQSCLNWLVAFSLTWLTVPLSCK
jgi:hypothetical protein